MLVTKNTRAKKDGSYISCPNCSNIVHVYHFAWFALTCTVCTKSVPKLEWIYLSK